MTKSAIALPVLLLVALLAATPSTGRGADAVVEFYRTQADAGQYVLHETSLYDLMRQETDACGWAWDFWQRAEEKFAAYPEAARLCGEYARNCESWLRSREKWLERGIEPHTATGGRAFHFSYLGEKDREGGILVLASDGSIRLRWVTCETSSGGWWSKWCWKRQGKALRRTIEKRAPELEANAAAAFLHNRPDAAAHSLHATSWRSLKLDLIFPDYNPDHPYSDFYETREEGGVLADVPGFLEFAKAEDAALQAWLAPRMVIAEKIEAEADPTDRLYWDVFDDGEHRRAGLLWLRWDGRVQQEWPDFGEWEDGACRAAGSGTEGEAGE